MGYVIKKQQDDGYYYKVINQKTRVVLYKDLSRFDAESKRDLLNKILK